MSQRGVDAALPAAFLAFGHEEASGVRPEAQAMDAGAAGDGSRSRAAAQRVSWTGRDGTAPAACARWRPSAEPLFLRPNGRRQDDARSDRRGAADGARVEAEVTRRSVSVCGCDSAPVAQAAWVLGLLTALLTITRKSDCLRAVWDGDRL